MGFLQGAWEAVPIRRRGAPQGVGARVEGGLRAAVRVPRCARICSITERWVMTATIRMAPWQVGQRSESTSKICRRSATQRRLASVGASRGMVTIGVGGLAPPDSARRRMPRGRLVN